MKRLWQIIINWRNVWTFIQIPLLVLISTLQSSGQTLMFNDTLRPFGPGGYDFASVCQDDSFYYIVGGVNNYETNWQDMLIKTDLYGNIIKKAKFTDPNRHYADFPFNSIEIQGNVLLTCPQLTDSIETKGILIAYDKHTLDTLWTKAIAHPDTQYVNQPGAHIFSELTTVTATPDGGFILTGNYTKYCITGNVRSFLLKLDSVGNIQWRKTYDDVTYLYSLALAPNGGYAFINRFSGINLVLADSLGNILWRKPKSGYLSLSRPADLVYDESGGFICTVYYQFGGTTSNPLFGVNVFRIDIATQSLSWDKTYIPYHHLQTYTLHEDLGINRLPDGTTVISGTVRDDPGHSGFILKLNQNADSLWCKNYFFGPLNQGHCQLNDLLLTDDGGFLGVGFYVPSGGDIAAWMFKTDANGILGIGDGQITENSFIRTFPNPAVSSITFDLSELKCPSSVNIFDMNGRLLFFGAINQDQTRYELQLSNYPAGLYFYQVLGERGRLASGKFVKVASGK